MDISTQKSMSMQGGKMARRGVQADQPICFVSVAMENKDGSCMAFNRELMSVFFTLQEMGHRRKSSKKTNDIVRKNHSGSSELIEKK